MLVCYRCSQQPVSVLYAIARTLTVLLLQSTNKKLADSNNMWVPQPSLILALNSVAVLTLKGAVSRDFQPLFFP